MSSCVDKPKLYQLHTGYNREILQSKQRLGVKKRVFTMTTEAEICEPTGPGNSVIWWGKAKQVSMPAKTKDYTYMQNDKFIKPQYRWVHGRLLEAADRLQDV